ncbi:hypothetical protein ARNL5_03586 [Anaerolineae bacterium]|nr:hypothetical protein ARNL5_03586 [Anaerolineae bacterium]
MNTLSLLLAFEQGALALLEPLLHRAPGLFGHLPSLGLLFAQATFDTALESFLRFLGRVLLLLGVAMIAFGGWLVNQGKTIEATLAITGGFITASAILIVRALAGLIGSTF